MELTPGGPDTHNDPHETGACMDGRKTHPCAEKLFYKLAKAFQFN